MLRQLRMFVKIEAYRYYIFNVSGFNVKDGQRAYLDVIVLGVLYCALSFVPDLYIDISDLRPVAPLAPETPCAQLSVKKMDLHVKMAPEKWP